MAAADGDEETKAGLAGRNDKIEAMTASAQLCRLASAALDSYLFGVDDVATSDDDVKQAEDAATAARSATRLARSTGSAPLSPKHVRSRRRTPRARSRARPIAPQARRRCWQISQPGSRLWRSLARSDFSGSSPPSAGSTSSRPSVRRSDQFGG